MGRPADGPAAAPRATGRDAVYRRASADGAASGGAAADPRGQSSAANVAALVLSGAGGGNARRAGTAVTAPWGRFPTGPRRAGTHYSQGREPVA